MALGNKLPIRAFLAPWRTPHDAVARKALIYGTVTLNGATAVDVSVPDMELTDAVIFSLNTVGGTVGAYPAIQTITAGVGFSVRGTALDTSVYNWVIIRRTF